MRVDDHPLLQRQHGCLAWSQAAAAGITPVTWNELTREHDWQRPHRGVIATPGADLARPLVRCWAALLTQCVDGHIPPGVALAKDSAIRLWFGDLLPSAPVDRLVVPVGYTGSSRPKVRLHQERTPAAALTTIDGLPVLSPAWTVLDVGRRHGRDRGVIAADTAYRLQLCSPAEVTGLTDDLARLPGVVAARQVADLSRPGTDSIPETELRLTLVDGGLPMPEVNIKIHDEWTGVLLARTELGYRHLLISLEYDGFLEHTSRHQFGRDRSRWRWWTGRGWHQLVFSRDDLRRPHQVVREVERAIAGAPSRILALDPHRSPEVAAAQAHLRARARRS